jgi:hypothetical protein
MGVGYSAPKESALSHFLAITLEVISLIFPNFLYSLPWFFFHQSPDTIGVLEPKSERRQSLQPTLPLPPIRGKEKEQTAKEKETASLPEAVSKQRQQQQQQNRSNNASSSSSLSAISLLATGGLVHSIVRKQWAGDFSCFAFLQYSF